jgi:hypothetical protein
MTRQTKRLLTAASIALLAACGAGAGDETVITSTQSAAESTPATAADTDATKAPNAGAKAPQ